MTKKKILIIEDDEVLRENTAEILELANYSVSTAENGKFGVEAAKAEKPDIIICDIMMPELDGYGVIYLLSKDPSTSKIPFIFLTAKSEKSDIRKGMSLGADDYLTKPFEEMDLLAAIEGRLKRNEVLQQEYASDESGLEQFIDNVAQLKSLSGLYEDRKAMAYKKKELIYREGDAPMHLYYLKKGKVKRYKTHEDGKEYIIEMLNEGSFFGHIPIMETSVYKEMAETLEDCELYRIPKEDFQTLLKSDREVRNAFVKILANNLYDQEKKLLSLAYDSVRRRTATALVELHDKFCDVHDPSCQIEIARADLANMVGTAPESVIRTLTDFKNEGKVKVDGKKIAIVDREGLIKIW